jgi:predicted transcriptional regulator
MTSEQMRAARALKRWDQSDLAQASGVSLPSIKRLESKPGEVAAQHSTVTALRRAFEEAGIVFLSDGDTTAGGIGVRMKG